jgi:hypothetical protein
MMRMNSVPRTIALPSPIGWERVSKGRGATQREQFAQAAGTSSHARTVREGREFVRHLSLEVWQSAAPESATMSGQDYRDVWLKLSGEAD